MNSWCYHDHLEYCRYGLPSFYIYCFTGFSPQAHVLNSLKSFCR